MDLPPEYVLHLLPLMAVCGIPPPQPRTPSPSENRNERSSSSGEFPGSSRSVPTLASIPYIEQDLGRAILKLIDQWRTLALWEPLASKERQVPGASLEGMFRVIPVDRVTPGKMRLMEQSFRLPPQKARISGDSGTEKDKEAHSPLSPLTPGSPLYPDGIMTTMWIRKHRDIIPSVFVSFYELKSEERPQNLSDEDLARHLIELKKSYAERGIKLCAVLTGPWEADDVISRLEYLRRNATLDAKTGLFYLPISQTESSLHDFFRMLRQSQYPFSVEHYRLRFNKTKRRRLRIPPALPNQPAPLDAKGWSVRTNFKLAAYSEYKQELDVAVKFYEIAYNELTDLFSSTAILPPRSKRWTEARILADSISYKLCKLLLYMGDHSRVVQAFTAHIKRMAVLCNGWGLGVEIAEYWHWLSRKYRVFADLLDISETIIVGGREIEDSLKMITGDTILNVDMILHHPGYYYLLAADCVRKEHLRSGGGKPSEEDKGDEVDLNAVMFENLSLSAEQFGRRGSRRTAAYVELARCKSHHFAGKQDVALELLHPVIRLYRGEQWFELLEEALVLGLDCAKKLDDEINVSRFSLELLSDEFVNSDHDNLSVPSFTFHGLAQSHPQSRTKTEILLNATEFVSFVKPMFTFKTKSAFAGSPVSFQLSLRLQARKPTTHIVFSSAHLYFNEQIPEIVIDNINSNTQELQRFGPNVTNGTADLSLQQGKDKVLEFSYTPVAQARIEALRLSLSLESDTHIFAIQFPFAELNLSSDGLWYSEHSNVPTILRLGNPRQLIVHPKPPKVSVLTSLHGPAYIGEKLPILLTLENGEDETVKIEIQYESPEAASHEEQEIFSWKRESSTASNSNTLFVGNVSSGGQHQCTLIFNAPPLPTDCTLNLAIQYTLESDGMTEIRKTLSVDIPVIQPFHTTFDILPRVTENGGMPDPFGEGEYLLDVSQTWLLVSSITRLGSEKLELQHIGVKAILDKEDMSLDILEGKGCSSTNQNIVLDTALHSAETNLVFTRRENTDITLLHLDLVVTWRRESSSRTHEWNTISIPIPELTFFPFTPRVLANVTPHSLYPEYPQYVVTYTFENPTSALLAIDVHFESTVECGFSGPNSFRLTLLAFTSYELKLIVIPVKEEWARLPQIIVFDNERKRALELLRATDDLKIEGGDLFLRVPPTN